MNSVLYYLLQVIIASAILYLYYHVALRNKKFHQYNRFYLLAAVVVSLLVPFLKIPVYFSTQATQSSFVLQTLTVISSSGTEETVSALPTEQVVASAFDPADLLYYVYAFLALFAFTRILLSLFKIRKLSRNNPVEKIDNINFVNTTEPATPFSFFHWLFWNRNIELRSEKGEQIFRHELFHIQQRHSLDIIFIELLTVVFWINPFFHLIKKELRAIHEFLADKFAINETEKWSYAELLLMQALQTKQSLVNPFFHNQIKRRIAMITSPQKTSHRYLRKLLVLPVTAILVILFAFRYKNSTIPIPIPSGDIVTIVIDAGHGGTDPGAMTADKKYSEALISLQIAKQIERLAKEYNINVVMTRYDNNLPGKATTKEDGLKKRVEIANRINPAAFISIHVNLDDNDMLNTHSGFEAYIANKKESVDSRLLASAILKELAPVYSTTPELKQSKEKGIYVLDHNKYPSVLLQCGYINNSKDLAFITNEFNQQKIARSILEAVVKYKKSETEWNGFNLMENIDTTISKTNSPAITLNGTVKTATIDPVNSKEPSKIVINGKEFNIKELTIEGLEDSKIEAAEFHISKGFMESADTAPILLIIIDGIRQTGNSTFENIDPATIESVNVYKEQTAMAKYGNEGRNGVIEIFTKNSNHKIKEITVEEKKLNDDGNIVFEKVEIEPSFPEGNGAWNKYLEKNFNPSIAAQNHAPAGEYTVYVQFIVDKEGNIRNIKALTNHGFGMEQEALRIMKVSPDWVPGIQNGHMVNAYRKQRFDFVVNKKTKDEVTN